MEERELKKLAPWQLRKLFREENLSIKTTGLAEGYTQANLVILPREFAFDFFLFCQRNPKPCPVLEVTDPGVPTVSYLAKEADLRTDLPLYRVYENGACIAEVHNIKDYWNDTLVAFLLGCSKSCYHALVRAGISLRGVSVFVTDIPCKAAGVFYGPLVVTMKPILRTQLIRAIQVTSEFPIAAHGAPVHWGDGRQIGIENISHPYSGDALTIGAEEIPVFWACGVTTHLAIMESKIPFAITHAPGHMFISDLPSEESAPFLRPLGAPGR